MLNWSSSTLANWCEELTHWKRPWCWERLKAGGEGDNRGPDGLMASPTGWTWVWASSRSWWCRGKPGMLQSMGSQRVVHNWVTELNWTEYSFSLKNHLLLWDIDLPKYLSSLGGGGESEEKHSFYSEISSVQFSSVAVVSNSLWPHESARQASLSITNFWSLLKRLSI